MTEDEAKTKWCPFTRVVVAFADTMSQAATANRDQPSTYGAYPGPTSCIGSVCMAWRWAQPGIVAGLDLSGTAEEVAARYPDAKSDGYCGLAGAPA